MKDNTIYVVGHINPDTDSICAAIAYAHFLRKKTGRPVIAGRAGNLNDETKYVLKYFKEKIPPLLKDVSGKNVIIVDHNEIHLAVPDIRKANIMEIIDHHRIGDVETIHPIEFVNQVRGATASIIAERYIHFNLPISKKMAGLMLSALLSDTILLNSPTTTRKDRILAKKLADIAGVNIQKYGRKMLESGCDLINQIPSKVILTDFKEYHKRKYKAGIGQVNIADTRIALHKKKALLDEMEIIRKRYNFNYIFLMITNIVSLHSDLLIACDEKEMNLASKVFKKKITNNMMDLKKTLSRKKQIQPKVLKILDML